MVTIRRFGALWLGSLLGATTASAKPPASSDFRASIEVILDESEPMATASSGKTLFQRAAEAALKSMEGKPAQSPNGDLSWRTVGGSEAKDDSACEATRVIISPGISPSPVLAALARETPRGPRPLGSAIEGAAGDVARDGRQRGLVIVTSGSDTCGRDACAVAADLRSTIGLGPVRVLFVGSDEQAASRVACLGELTMVSDPAQLRPRLREAIEALDQPADLTVSVIENGQQIAARVELIADDDANPVVKGKSGDAFRVLPGTYQIHVVRPLAANEEPSTLHDGWRRKVELVAGSQLAIRVPIGVVAAAQIQARVQLNGVPAPMGTRVSIFHVGDTEAPVGQGVPGEAIRVPPGRYDVRAEIPGGPADALQVWKPEVTVGSGETVAVSFVAVQKRGTLRVEVLVGGQPSKDAQVMLLPPGSRRETQALFAPGIEIPVPIGRYTVAARFETPGGRLEARKDDIVIAADRTTAVRLDTGSTGRLEVKIAGRKAEDGIAIGLVKPGESEALGSMMSFVEYLLPVGKFDLRVEENRTGGPRVYWQRNVSVVAGEKTVVSIKPP